MSELDSSNLGFPYMEHFWAGQIIIRSPCIVLYAIVRAGSNLSNIDHMGKLVGKGGIGEYCFWLAMAAF